MIRTRIAPSPTGKFHIGTARTALFNYLYAKSQGGKFIIRIEDTDKIRSTKESEQDILKGMNWLSLKPDEGVTLEGEIGEYAPYRQSERTAIYRKYLEILLEKGIAYWDNTTKEELDKLNQESKDKKETLVFRPKSRDEKLVPNETSVIRFRVENKIIRFEDKIKGKIEFDTALLSDFVIAKSLGEPLYNFVVVIDDELMQITHIIRGEDHISNTPKQILINTALEFSRKNYGHLPLILAPDRSKMSKRFGATSVDEYIEQGYLPEALLNFLALLGWNEGNDREEYSINELIQKFNLKRVQKSGAVFNIDKLNSINSKYIKKLSNDDKLNLGKEFLQKSQNKDLLNLEEDKLEYLILMECNRIKKFGDIGNDLEFVLNIIDYDKSILIWKDIDENKIVKNLKWCYNIIASLDENRFEDIESIIKLELNKNNFNFGEYLWPLRVCLSGKKQSPSPFEIMNIIGKKETIIRINIAISKFI